MPLTLLTTFRLWIPVTLMWLLIAFEQPLLHSSISRVEQPVLNLAAYGYSFFSMLILESPVFMFISAANTLVKGEKSFYSFIRFAYPICIIFSFLLVIVSISGSFYWLTVNVVGLSPELAALSDDCFLILAVCPMMVGYRRLHQGVLIKAGANRWLVFGSLIRIFFDLAGVIFLLYTTDLYGAKAACLAMSVAVTAEAYFVRWRVSKLDFKSLDHNNNDQYLTTSEMAKFYVPLAISSFVLVGGQPLLTFFIAQALEPKLSLAAWPVLSALSWLFLSGIIAMQEVIIAEWGKHPDNPIILKKFSIYIAIIITSLISLLILTPLYNLWFGSVLNITPELVSFMWGAGCIMILSPVLTMWQCWMKSQHAINFTTHFITNASVIELLGIPLFALIFIINPSITGVYYAAIASIGSRFLSCLYLLITCRRATIKY